MTEEAHDNKEQDDEQPGWMVASGRELKDAFGFTAKNRPTIKLNPENLPEALHPLIPVAEAWGISDDLIRGDVIDQASPEALREFVATIRENEDLIYGWLGDPEVYLHSHSEEFYAFTAMMLVFGVAQYRVQ